MSDSSSELEKAAGSTDIWQFPDSPGDNVQDKDSILKEHTDQGEHNVGEKNCIPVQDSIEQHNTKGTSVMVTPKGTSSNGSHSEPASYEHEFEITPDWLSNAIKNPLITVKAAPILLCITGLPNSNLSIFTNHLLHQLQCERFTFSESKEQLVHFHETSAVRIPGDPTKQLTYSKSFHYSTVIESAIKHQLYLTGKLITNIEFPVFNPNVFKEKELDGHFKSMIDEFYINSKKHTHNLVWNQGLPSGIALINMWEIGHSKAAAYILPLLSGYLHNSYIWLLFDIIRDLPSLYEPPAKNEINGRMESQPRLHYLLRFAKLAVPKKNSKCTKVCKLISYHEGVETVEKQQEDKVKQFQMDVDFLATQMGVNELIDIDNIHLLNSDQKSLKVIKKAFDDIVNNSLDKPVEIPLSYIFLRSLYYNNKSLLYISKKDLKTKAKHLKLNDNDLRDFCLLFTTFGSIIDVSLIDPSSDIIILQPIEFFHEVDKLFHPNADIDPLLSKYGIVTEDIASSIFRNRANVIMESLVSFGIAAKLSSSQVNYTLPAPNDVVYYIPYASTSLRDYNCQPTALHLLRDFNRPMSHSKVAFVSKFLNHCNSALLELPDTPVGNITKFKVTSSNGSKVVFEFAYLPDAFEFRFQPPYNQKHEEIQEISKNIIVVCNDIMQVDTKYNFAVMCSADMEPKLTTRLKRKRHLLPNRMICPECKSKGLHNYDLIEIWSQLLINEEKCKVPETKKLNGEPLTADDACSVVKGLEKLSDNTLHVAARYLDMPDFLTSAKRRMWRKCMTMILDWEDKSLLSEDEELKREASKKVLAIKLMHAANEIYTVNKEESRALENVAKSLNFEVTCSMSISGKSDQNAQNEDALLPKRKDYTDIINTTDLLQEMLIVGKKVCQCYANTENIVSVEDCGLTLIIPAEVIIPAESSYEVTAQGLWGESKFKFPEGSKLISGVCHISVSNLSELNRPVSVLLKHCAEITDENQTKYLSFVIAKSGPPFKFEYLQGGTFSLQSQYGHICLKRFSLLAIVVVISGVAIGALATLGQPVVEAAVGVVTDLLVHPRCHYEAYIFYKNTGSRNWDMNFVVIQDHPYSTSLIEKRKFEYGTKDDSFRFCFTEDSLLLSDFPEEGELQGWTVVPKRALKIDKSQADDFNMSKSANPPYISVIISCNPDCKNITGHYITIKGVDCQSFLFLKLQSLIYETSINILRQAPDKKEVLEILSNISARWHHIGLALGVNSNDLENIETDAQDHTIKLSKVIEKWITTQSSPVSWKTLISAIEGPIVNDKQKATEIRHYLNINQ